ncbi:hypothetical protein [Subtercola sp. RTI3]|uniref:hypothetical protein n=1 Tax=Subtercola sp. RTI3 TaxID=3048639 RepID=UPI002B22904F|nr:hypothetical protein [Subtercola sp. RTI3]MEA9983753.1 hypothetical protein [Subtercola sp. RTI3]
MTSSSPVPSRSAVRKTKALMLAAATVLVAVACSTLPDATLPSDTSASAGGSSSSVAAASPAATDTSATSSALAWVTRQNCAQIMGDTILPELAAASGGAPVLFGSGGFSRPFDAYQCIYQTGAEQTTNVYFVVAAVTAAEGGRPAAEANFADAYTKSTFARESIYSVVGKPIPTGTTPSTTDAESYAATVIIASDDAFVTVGSASGGTDTLARITAWAHDIDSRLHAPQTVTAHATAAPAN